jgi:hypothetical protein
VPLEGVRHELAAGRQLITPGVGFALKPATLREFKLGFRRLARMIHDGSSRNRGAALRDQRAEP